jgi:hypothetical protein
MRRAGQRARSRAAVRSIGCSPTAGSVVRDALDQVDTNVVEHGQASVTE